MLQPVGNLPHQPRHQGRQRKVLIHPERNGYMYVLDFVRAEQPGDRRFRFDDVTLYVDEKSLAVVNGTRVDYVQEGLNSLYKFHNPNATGECGCGESFTVK